MHYHLYDKEEIKYYEKRVLAALLVTMMTVGTVAGCGSNAKSDDSDKKQVQSLRVMTKKIPERK